jgi:hypothetical protein
MRTICETHMNKCKYSEIKERNSDKRDGSKDMVSGQRRNRTFDKLIINLALVLIIKNIYMKIWH